jgi:hypothetical protein
MADTPEYIWRYGGIDVTYSPDLDRGGSYLAPSFVAFIKDFFGGHRFGTVFEWCAGPGFIGFALLADGLCDSLCLADINPVAIDCVRKTTRVKSLQDRVRSYVSDNLLAVPPRERFDLVVGTPPSWCAKNRARMLYTSISYAEGPGWGIRAGFYSQIAQFLNPGASVLVLEVEPHSREVFVQDHSVPWDVRPEEPASTFTKMMLQGGLTHVGDFQLVSGQKPELWLQISRRPA